jgi:hypothetical protein
MKRLHDKDKKKRENNYKYITSRIYTQKTHAFKRQPDMTIRTPTNSHVVW